MQIGKETVVGVHYELRLNDENGALQEKTQEGNPLVFLFGVGQLLPDFENNLENKKVGDKVAFPVPADRAYGVYDPNAVIDLPIAQFMRDGVLQEDLLQVGRVIQLRDNQNRPVQAKIMLVGKESVKMDLNHPMAGKDLHFTVTVDSVRASTKEENEHRHAHGPGGHQH